MDMYDVCKCATVRQGIPWPTVVVKAPISPWFLRLWIRLLWPGIPSMEPQFTSAHGCQQTLPKPIASGLL